MNYNINSGYGQLQAIALSVTGSYALGRILVVMKTADVNYDMYADLIKHDPDGFVRLYGTVQAAVNAAQKFDTILVFPGTYTENIDLPLAGTVRNVTLAAVSSRSGGLNGAPGLWADDQVTLLGTGDTSDYIINVRSQGWRITGFRICVASSSAGIYLPMANAAETSGTAVSPFTVIGNNFFWLNQDGIHITGAPHSVHILNNEFQLMTGSAIKVVATPIKVAANFVIKGNFFNNNTNDINCPAQGFWNSIITDNWFNDAGATQVLNNGGGGRTLVSGNHFNGTYAISGGYKGGSNDDWAGNTVDNRQTNYEYGFTTKPPA